MTITKLRAALANTEPRFFCDAPSVTETAKALKAAIAHLDWIHQVYDGNEVGADAHGEIMNYLARKVGYVIHDVGHYDDRDEEDYP